MIPRRWFDAREEAQLRRLVNEAVELRGTGYVSDACAAIVDWRQRSLPDRLERHALPRKFAPQERQARNEALVVLLRETGPRTQRRAAA